MAVLLCTALLSGCGKQADNGPTTSELMEQYAENYTAPEDVPVIWLYGKEDTELFSNLVTNYNWNCNNGGDSSKAVRLLTYHDMTPEQFATKVQAEIMSGKGPDLILTSDANIFPDVNKAVAAGAFQNWDDILADWDKEQYLYEAAKGTYSPDGKCYILPLSFEPIYIVTTKTNMEKYGFTEADFSDFAKTTDTLLRLWEQIEGDNTVAVHQKLPDFVQAVSGLLDYESGKTSLLAPETRELFDQWQKIIFHQSKRVDLFAIRAEQLMQQTDANAKFNWKLSVYNLDTSLGENADAEFGKHYGLMNILEFVTADELDALAALPNDPEAQKDFLTRMEDVVYFPLYDTNQRVVGTVRSYALLASGCKSPETIAAFMRNILLHQDENGDISDPNLFYGEGVTLGMTNELELAYESCVSGDEEMKAYTKQYVETRIGKLSHAPTHLVIWNSTLKAFSDGITDSFLDPEHADWEDLETDINIYLSE